MRPFQKIKDAEGHIDGLPARGPGWNSSRNTGEWKPIEEFRLGGNRSRQTFFSNLFKGYEAKDHAPARPGFLLFSGGAGREFRPDGLCPCQPICYARFASAFAQPISRPSTKRC